MTGGLFRHLLEGQGLTSTKKATNLILTYFSNISIGFCGVLVNIQCLKKVVFNIFYPVFIIIMCERPAQPLYAVKAIKEGHLLDILSTVFELPLFMAISSLFHYYFLECGTVIVHVVSLAPRKIPGTKYIFHKYLLIK